MRGAPSQWAIGSQWIADGGVYPMMGETIGLAGTSPERAGDGLYNDGGSVGDPPFDSYSQMYFDQSIGADPGSGAAGVTAPGPAGGEGDMFGVVTRGAIGVIGVTFLYLYAKHKGHGVGGGNFASIKGTAGDVAIIALAATAGIPLVKIFLSFLTSLDVPIFSDITGDMSTYANAA